MIQALHEGLGKYKDLEHAYMTHIKKKNPLERLNQRGHEGEMDEMNRADQISQKDLHVLSSSSVTQSGKCKVLYID